MKWTASLGRHGNRQRLRIGISRRPRTRTGSAAARRRAGPHQPRACGRASGRMDPGRCCASVQRQDQVVVTSLWRRLMTDARAAGHSWLPVAAGLCGGSTQRLGTIGAQLLEAMARSGWPRWVRAKWRASSRPSKGRRCRTCADVPRPWRQLSNNAALNRRLNQ
jgi:hypothetical protein